MKITLRIASIFNIIIGFVGLVGSFEENSIGGSFACFYLIVLGIITLVYIGEQK
jgi:hypothetical protein